MRTLGVVTAGRSDYGLLLPVLRRIQEDSELSLRLFVTGMHLSPEFGQTGELILSDGFCIDERTEMLLSSDTPEGTAKSMGLGVLGFAQAFGRRRPDLLLVLGDRFEVLAAVLAALPFNLPVGHVHGGETTEGAIDEAIRHAITKMAHLHFTATTDYARRVVQMGEEPWRVTVSGAPGLDDFRTVAAADPEELERAIGMKLDAPLLLATFHPMTLAPGQAGAQVGELLAALGEVDCPILFTYPNADAGGRALMSAIEAFAGRHPRVVVVPNLGTRLYVAAMRCARAMVGNSSSGIIEAASFCLPVVNIGDRQRGRTRGLNVIDCEPERVAIATAIATATSADFRASLQGLQNPYGDGRAAERIVSRLKAVALDQRLLMKRFHNLPGDGGMAGISGISGPEAASWPLDLSAKGAI